MQVGVPLTPQRQKSAINSLAACHKRVPLTLLPHGGRSAINSYRSWLSNARTLFLLAQEISFLYQGNLLPKGIVAHEHSSSGAGHVGIFSSMACHLQEHCSCWYKESSACTRRIFSPRASPPKSIVAKNLLSQCASHQPTDRFTSKAASVSSKHPSQAAPGVSATCSLLCQGCSWGAVKQETIFSYQVIDRLISTAVSISFQN
jgi:hypothetical protein